MPFANEQLNIQSAQTCPQNYARLKGFKVLSFFPQSWKWTCVPPIVATFQINDHVPLPWRRTKVNFLIPWNHPRLQKSHIPHHATLEFIPKSCTLRSCASSHRVGLSSHEWRPQKIKKNRPFIGDLYISLHFKNSWWLWGTSPSPPCMEWIPTPQWGQVLRWLFDLGANRAWCFAWGDEGTRFRPPSCFTLWDLERFLDDVDFSLRKLGKQKRPRILKNHRV